MSLTLTKTTETSSTITLGWTPPPGVGGYVLYAAGQAVSVATAKLKDGTLRKEAKFSKTSPGPPYQVAAVCRAGDGTITVEYGMYVEAPPLPPNVAVSSPTNVVTT
jgi:hypothetical protein